MPRKKKEQPNRADGLYEVKMTVGKKMDGSPIRKSFYSHVSKDDARRQGQKYIQDIDRQSDRKHVCRKRRHLRPVGDQVVGNLQKGRGRRKYLPYHL